MAERRPFNLLKAARRATAPFREAPIPRDKLAVRFEQRQSLHDQVRRNTGRKIALSAHTQPTPIAITDSAVVFPTKGTMSIQSCLESPHRFTLSDINDIHEVINGAPNSQASVLVGNETLLLYPMNPSDTVHIMAGVHPENPHKLWVDTVLEGTWTDSVKHPTILHNFDEFKTMLKNHCDMLAQLVQAAHSAKGLPFQAATIVLRPAE